MCATLNGLPIGYLIASQKAESLHIHHIAVQNDYRNRNIGYLLMRNLETNMVAQDIKLPMTLKVFNKNDKAKPII